MTLAAFAVAVLVVAAGSTPVAAATKQRRVTLHPVVTDSGQRDARGASRRGRRTAIPLRVPSRKRLRALKRRMTRRGSVAARRLQANAPPPPFAPRAALALDGLGLAATDNSFADRFSTPPDSTGAIGPAHYVEMVNRRVAVYGRGNLAPVSSLSLSLFTETAGEAGEPDDDNLTDPQVIWDERTGRWYYLALELETATDFALDFGWSRTSDPSDLDGGWCNLRVETGTLLNDYPKLGDAGDFLMFGTNVFENDEDAFVSAQVWSVPKPGPGTSCPASVTPFASSISTPLTTGDGDIVFTPVPANWAGGAGTGYVVAADAPFFGVANEIAAWSLDAAGSSLIGRGDVGVSGFDLPANVPQPGTAAQLDSLDARLTQAVGASEPAAGGAPAVWTSHTVEGPGGRSAVRWYELLPGLCSGGACPPGALRQEGTLVSPTEFLFNAAVSPAASGAEAAINFNAASASLTPQIRAQSRHAGTPGGAMEGEITLGSSAAPAVDLSCSGGGPCRWGDYSGATPDPAGQSIVWGSNQLIGPVRAGGLPAWMTRNFALDAAGKTVLPPNQAPVASFTMRPNPTFVGGLVRFDGSRSSDPDGTVVSYRWDLDGNGSFETDTGANPRASRRYGSARRVPVKLRVTDDRGATAEGAATSSRRELQVRWRRLRARVRLSYEGTGDGIVVRSLSVARLPRGARAELRCRRGRARPCRRQVRRAGGPSPVAIARTVRFRSLRGRRLRARAVIELRVTQRRRLGRYFRWTVKRGRASRVQRCLEPGSRKPRRRCG
jgi:hypothetical protein